MAYEVLEPFKPAVQIFEGSARCPKTVVISIIDLPSSGNPDAWISQSKESLDKAKDVTSFHFGRVPYLSAGIPVIDFEGETTRLVLPHVTGNIWARATNYDVGSVSPSKPKRNDPLGVVVILIESF